MRNYVTEGQSIFLWKREAIFIVSRENLNSEYLQHETTTNLARQLHHWGLKSNVLYTYLSNTKEKKFSVVFAFSQKSTSFSMWQKTGAAAAGGAKISAEENWIDTTPAAAEMQTVMWFLGGKTVFNLDWLLLLNYVKCCMRALTTAEGVPY